MHTPCFLDTSRGSIEDTAVDNNNPSAPSTIHLHLCPSSYYQLHLVSTSRSIWVVANLKTIWFMAKMPAHFFLVTQIQSPSLSCPIHHLIRPWCHHTTTKRDVSILLFHRAHLQRDTHCPVWHILMLTPTSASANTIFYLLILSLPLYGQIFILSPSPYYELY